MSQRRVPTNHVQAGPVLATENGVTMGIATLYCVPDNPLPTPVAAWNIDTADSARRVAMFTPAELPFRVLRPTTMYEPAAFSPAIAPVVPGDSAY